VRLSRQGDGLAQRPSEEGEPRDRCERELEGGVEPGAGLRRQDGDRRHRNGGERVRLALEQDASQRQRGGDGRSHDGDVGARRQGVENGDGQGRRGRDPRGVVSRGEGVPAGEREPAGLPQPERHHGEVEPGHGEQVREAAARERVGGGGVDRTPIPRPDGPHERRLARRERARRERGEARAPILEPREGRRRRDAHGRRRGMCFERDALRRELPGAVASAGVARSFGPAQARREADPVPERERIGRGWRGREEQPAIPRPEEEPLVIVQPFGYGRDAAVEDHLGRRVGLCGRGGRYGGGDGPAGHGERERRERREQREAGCGDRRQERRAVAGQRRARGETDREWKTGAAAHVHARAGRADRREPDETAGIARLTEAKSCARVARLGTMPDPARGKSVSNAATRGERT
jgi:hypothetical protein